MREEYRNSARILQAKEIVEMVNGQKNNYSNYPQNSEIEKLLGLKERGILSELEYSSLKGKIIAFEQNFEARPVQK